MKKEHLEEVVKSVFKNRVSNEDRKCRIQNAHFKISDDDVTAFTKEGVDYLTNLFKEEIVLQSRLMENWDTLKSNWSHEMPLTFISKDRKFMIDEFPPGKFRLIPNTPDTSFYKIFPEEIVRDNYFDIMEIVYESNTSR